MTCMYTTQGMLVCNNIIHKTLKEHFINEITNEPVKQSIELDCLIQQSNLQQTLPSSCEVTILPNNINNNCSLSVQCKKK